MKLPSINSIMLLLKKLHSYKKEKKIYNKCWLAIITLIFFSCNDTFPEKAKMVKSLADLECRAIELKNKRFQLADNIRFAQDTLLHFKSTTDTILLELRLKEWDIQKLLLVNKSLALADSIKLQMEIIMSRYFTDKKKEQEFNVLLDAALKKNGCK
jgi:hypothetical protein